jgi:lipoprotein NlpD
MRRILRTVLALALLASFAACATSYDKRGVYHKVRSGESPERIAKIYRVDLQELAEFNNILKPTDIRPGARLYIPAKKRRASFKKLPFGDGARVASSGKRGRGRRPARYSNKIRTYRGRFIWPVSGKLTSRFGMRNGRRHDGIDVSAPSGTSIKAAAAGRVVFSGSMRGYGKLILIRHKDNMFTAYAHNRTNKVKKGQNVKKGQLIAKVGRTGRASGNHLHFEIRHGQTARNPLFFLPARASTKRAIARKSKKR